MKKIVAVLILTMVSVTANAMDSAVDEKASHHQALHQDQKNSPNQSESSGMKKDDPNDAHKVSAEKIISDCELHGKC